MSKNTGLEIAIIGMAGRFPKADNIEEYWNNLINDIESISFFTDEELKQNGVSEKDLQNPLYVKANSYVRDKEYFDSNFFSYRPDEAKIMDPQIRIFQECVWSAIEDAGINIKKNNNIGVFASASPNLNWQIYSKIINSNGLVDNLTASQLDNARFLSSRISYLLNLTGPSVFIDTGCSSSLVCIHNACRSLLLSDCYTAIAGGVKISNTSIKGYQYQPGLIISKDGHCCPFDEKASGTISGEGAGVVVLKKLSDAIKDGDRIDAIIKGTGINNDGNEKIGYTAPSINGQVEVIMRALKWSKVEPESIGFVETHGTGTTLGDPIEFEALNRTFGKSEKPYCALGSVKSNIGHLDAASGIASVIKTVLALKNKQIPATLNYTKPNPKIDFNKSAFYVNTELKDWQNNNQPLRAGVSSFGIGGTNVHAILEQAPESEKISTSRDSQLLVFSAKTHTALERNIKNFTEYLKNNQDVKLSDFAYTLQVGRVPFAYRKMIVCKDRKEAIDVLSLNSADNKIEPLSDKDTNNVVFMFSGQGSQYLGMCYGLYNSEDTFKKDVDKCLDLVKQSSGKDLKPIIFTDNEEKGSGNINNTEYTQPALFIIEYALARLLMKWGISPNLMIGHSIGEYVAACISGVFSLEDALILVTKRGELMQKVSKGTMLSISISESNLQSILNNHQDISLAAVNSSELCVVSGTEESINNFKAILEKEGYLSKEIRTSHAFHSCMMDEILDEFKKEVSKIKINKQQIPFISNLSGKQAIDTEISKPQYWVRHLRESVRFSEGIESVLTNKKAIFIEVGPGNVLGTFVRSNKLREKGHKVVSLVKHPNDNTDDLKYLLSGLGEIWLNGVEPTWDSFYENEVRSRLSLPTYSFDKIKYPTNVNAYEMISKNQSVEASKKRKNLNEWFYVPTWKLSHKNKSKVTTIKDDAYLIFEDSLGVSNSLIEKLCENKANVIRVSIGKKYAKHNSQHYFINPEVESDYLELFSNLNESGNSPNRIIHSFGITKNIPEYLTEEEFTYLSNIFFHSLIHVIKAAQKYGGILGKNIQVLTSDLHSIYQSNQCPAVKSLVLGLLKIIPQEYPTTNCKHIDITLEESDKPGFIDNIYQEIVSNMNDKTVSLRHSKRWVQAFENIITSNKIETSFKPNAVYLITGGLGWLGYTISTHLAKSYQAKLIILGKTNLPEQETWEMYLTQENADKLVTEKIKKLQALQAEGAEVLYISCDFSSPIAFSEAIKKSEESIGKINGIIHAAGVTKGKSMNTISQLEYSDFAEQFKPKITGLEILIDSFKNRDLDFCLITSSLSAILGGLRFGAYSPANVYMDYRIRLLREKALLNNWVTIDFERGLSTMAMSNQEVIEVVDQTLHLKDYSQVIVSITEFEKRLSDWVLNRGEIEKPFDNEESEEESQTELREIIETGLTKTEESVIILWQKFFNISGLSVSDEFFEIGGDSLKALTMIARIYKEFGVEITITDFFRNSSVKSLSNLIDKNDKTEYVKIELAPKKDSYKLSSAQKRLFFLYEFDKKSLAYNISQVVKLEGNVDKEKLNNAFSKLINCHESLRTSFELENDKAVQKISDQIEFEIEYFSSSEEQVQQVIKNFIRPFDLSKAPLLRVGLIEVGTMEHILMVDMHHIISDGVSQGVLIKDFMALYKGEEITELKLQYKDYAEWQQSEEQQGKISKQKDFWLNEYAEEVTTLDLPTNKKRPPIKSNEGDTIGFNFSADETKKLKSIAESEGSTLFMVLLSMYNIFLGKLSNQEDIVVGTPVAGRQHVDLESMIGMFVNTLPMRNYPKGELKYNEFLLQVKNKTLACFDNQTYQYEELIDKLKVVRDMSRNPLFDTIFVFQNFEKKSLEISDIKLQSYNTGSKISKFDLSLAVSELNEYINLSFGYSTELFSKETIKRFIAYFKKVVTDVISNPRIELSKIEIITEKEKQQLLYEFNDSQVEYPKDNTIIELFEEQVKRTPQNIAVSFNHQAINYYDLNSKANQLGRVIRQKGIKPDDIVAMILDRSIDMIVGMLAILKAGGAYLPIDPNYPEDRKEHMLEDSKSSLIITQKSLLENIPSQLEKIDIENEEIYLSEKDDLKKVNKPNDLAYIIYTSGSTGTPKGVMLEHENVVRLMINDKQLFDFTENDVWTMFHSYCFDFSVWEMYGALLFGGKLLIIPVLMARDAKMFLELLKKEHVTVLNQTPSAFYRIIDEVVNENPNLFLKYIIFGGEKLLPSKLKAWQDLYPQTKLINMYGITETTIHVTYKELNEEDISKGISNVGHPIPTTTTYIMDKYRNLQPVGAIGEIYVGGKGVARGYIGKEKLMRERFIENPFLKADRLYKSGDLGRFLENGDIEYIDRSDNQVQIRGFRIELGEIETNLLKYDKIKEAHVTTKGEYGEKNLCAYIVSEEEIEISELRSYLSLSLPDYMLPSYFVFLEVMPLTPNGKIDRKALPEPENKPGDDYVAPQTIAQKELAAIWSEILGFDNIGIRSDYFALGGDSIRIIGLVSKINKKFGVNIGVIDVYKNTSIEKLSFFLEGATESEDDQKLLSEVETYINDLKNEVLEIHPSPEIIEDVYPMSDIEKGISFYYSGYKDVSMYHDQFSYTKRIENFDKQRFQKAFDLLMSKHETLRCGFNMVDYKEPVRLVYKNLPTCLHIDDISDKSAEEQKQHIVELTKNDFKNLFEETDFPLWRFQVCILDKDNVYALFTFHHAIIDGWSQASLTVELLKIYDDLELNPDMTPKPLSSSYKDFVIKEIIGKRDKRHINFWKEELSGYQRTSIPTPIQEEAGNIMNTYYKFLDSSIFEKLEKVALKNQTSLKNLCFAAYAYVLNMYSYGQEVVAGCVTNSRPLKEDGEKIIGCFLNTVPIRLIIPQNITWVDYIKMVEEKMLGVKEHEEISLNEISRGIGERNINKNPIFDTLFNFLNFYVFGELGEKVYAVDSEISSITENVKAQQITNTQFDFEISITNGRFIIKPKYNTNLYNRDFISQFCENFVNVLNCFIHNPKSLAISNNVLLENKRKQLLYDFNETKTSYASQQLMHELFEKSVVQYPEKIAISFGNNEITYNQLNKKSNQIAAVLRQKGIKPGELVPVIIDRSIEMIGGMLGILKAGGAYVPIEHYLPQARINSVLNQIQPKSIITSVNQLSALSKILEDNKSVQFIFSLTEDNHIDPVEFPKEKTLISTDEIGEQANDNLKPITTSEDIAYIIFTSGSTGIPKGVQVKHKPVINLLEWVNKEFKVTHNDKLLFITSIGFDLSVYDIFGTLAAGGTIRLTSSAEQKNPEKLLEIIVKEGITIWDSAPAALQQLLPLLGNTSQYTETPKLRLTMLSGDWIPLNMPPALKNAFKEIEVLAMGGATEATIWSNYHVVQEQNPKWRSIPYGKPIQNAKYYILDNMLNVCPIGAPGDLYIGGNCLASGYYNDTELSNSKFIPNPYEEGEIIYKTGDIGRRMFAYETHEEEGNIEFFGRIDDQVKVHGYRIETGDIQTCLLKHPLIKDAVVIVNKSTDNDNYLCAYYISSEELDKKEISQFLQNELPVYMIPKHFIRIEKIPITSNGKLDRNALPYPNFEDKDNYVAPSNEIENSLVEIWSEVLEIEKDKIGINSNFFEIGGHSLNVIKLNKLINSRLNCKISIANMFMLPTITALAEYIIKGDQNIKEMADNLDEAIVEANENLSLLDRLNS